MASVGDDSVEALQNTLQNAFAVLGRRPDVVSGISDERKYERQINQLTQQLDQVKADLEFSQSLHKKTVSEKETITNTLFYTANELKTVKGQLLDTQNELKDSQAKLAELQSELEKQNSVLEATKKSLGEVKTDVTTQVSTIETLRKSAASAAKETADMRNDFLTQLKEKNMDLEAFKESFRKFAEESNLEMDRQIRQQVATAHISDCVIKRSLLKNRFLKWSQIALQKKSSLLTSELAVSDKMCDQLSEQLDSTRKTLKTTDDALKDFERRRDTSVSVGCMFSPKTVDKGTNTIEPKARRDAHFSMSHGSPTELDEIAKLRWEVDRQQKEFMRHMEDRAAVIAFMEMEMGRISDDLLQEKVRRGEVEKARDKVIKELNIVQSVLSKQNRSIQTLNSDYNKAETVVQNRVLSQLEAAASDMQQSLGRAAVILANQNNSAVLRLFFQRWKQNAHNTAHAKLDVGTQHKDRSILESQTMMANVMMKKQKSELILRYLWHWSKNAATLRAVRIERETRKYPVSLGTQTKYPSPTASTTAQTSEGTVVLSAEDASVAAALLSNDHGNQNGRKLAAIFGGRVAGNGNIGHLEPEQRQKLLRQFRNRNASADDKENSLDNNDTPDKESALEIAYINKRLEKLRLAHYVELADAARQSEIQRLAADENNSRTRTIYTVWFKWRSRLHLRQQQRILMTEFDTAVANHTHDDVAKYRLHVASLSRDAENTALLLEQANAKVSSFQTSMEQLRAALAQSNSINQLLSSQNKTLRGEVEISRREKSLA